LLIGTGVFFSLIVLIDDFNGGIVLNKPPNDKSNPF
jgi:hypothetical protein